MFSFNILKKITVILFLIVCFLSWIKTENSQEYGLAAVEGDIPIQNEIHSINPSKSELGSNDNLTMNNHT
jgi:hypothetical protein